MEDNYIVETSYGKVRGYSRRGVIKFKGIPYAAPPIGNLRFKAPAPVDSWSDVRDATRFSPVAPQPPSTLESLFGEPMPQSEAECLTINIWTNDLNAKGRPVMFWIHGGGFITGSGASLDGARLVQRGNVVVVSINYRLGYLGFLYMPDVSDADTNVGLLDMIAALKWVKENISFFGGDPNNVTIFGESAGGMAVSTLLAMPSAKRLFHRAISQSGAAHKLGFNPKVGTKVYEDLLKDLDVKKGDIQVLRKIPIEKFLIPQEPTLRIQEDVLRLGPIIDKMSLPEHPLEVIRKGFAKNVDLLIGTNLDESKLWLLLTPQVNKLTEEELLQFVKGRMNFLKKDEITSKMLIDIYREGRKTPRNIMEAILTDYSFRIPAIQLAEAQCEHQPNTYMYLFAWKHPMDGGKYGAMHALELPFVFGLLGNQDVGFFPRKSEETLSLSEKMMDTWISFVYNGNPNHKNIPELPPYNKEKRSTIIFDKDVKVEEDPYGNERMAWDNIL